jgi:hypothetical protein
MAEDSMQLKPTWRYTKGKKLKTNFEASTDIKLRHLLRQGKAESLTTLQTINIR